MSRPVAERPRPSQIASHLGVMAIVSVVLGVVVAGLAIPFAGLVGFGAKSAQESMDELPQALEQAELAQKTEIYDVQGNIIATVFDENRVNVELDKISKVMIKAILSIEDYRFFEHGAIDMKGTIRAFVTNQASSDVVQGGSTITQQLVKLTLLSQATTKAEREAATDRTYARKWNELRYAVALEKKYSKEWILERYLNIAYFGDGAYGIQSAAKHYYNVNASKLNLNQAATLAGLVQNPSAFDPTNYPDRAENRRDVVLDRMADLSVIPEKRAERVQKRDLQLDVQPSANGCVNSVAPFFCDYVIEYLKKDPALGQNVKERKELIYSGGLRIHTTLDQRFQKAADESVRSHVYKENNAIGALAMVEPGTGEVRAIAQSRPMGRKKEDGFTYLNYVVPTQYGDSNGFQAGSTFKAFVLASAIRKGIPLSKTINAPQQVFIPMRDYRTCDGFYQSSDIYDPQNSSGSGKFNLYTGTRQSVNTFFAQLEKETGLCDPFNLAKDLGIQLTSPDTEMVPSFTLGVASVSPLEMAEAYATFAARGLHCDSQPVTRIEDAEGNELKKYRPKCSQVLAGSVADAVNDVLRGVLEPGGFGYNSNIHLPERDDAGKTGTTNSGLAVWFVGYTPKIATASMIAGADINGNWISLAGQSLGPRIVYSAAGSTVAGPMWGDAMKPIQAYLPDADFTRPSGTDIEGLLVDVPTVAGMPVGEARQTLEDAGFVAVIGDYVNSGYAEDVVAYSSPGAGSELSSGDTVYMYVSNGRKPPKPKPKNKNRGRGNNNGNGGRGG